jgi:hypothetical protein
VGTFGKIVSVEFALFKFLRVSKSYFTNDEEANTTREV